MSDVVIHVEKLSKRYRIGHRERYLALRDTLAHSLTAPLRLLASRSAKPITQNPTPNHIWALKDVTFEVKKGDVVGCWLYGLNPMAGVNEGFRWSLTGQGQPPSLLLLASVTAVVLMLIGGFIYFQKLEETIVDVV